MLLCFLFSASVSPLKPIYLVSGFDDSPIYSNVYNSFLYPECPNNINLITIKKDGIYNTEFFTRYHNCAAKLLRVQLNQSTKKVDHLPGISSFSTSINDPSIFYYTFGVIIDKINTLGYQNNINFFSIGYNYFLHPVTSYAVYKNLKEKIEQVYSQTGEKSIFISFDQGTSFTSIFLSNYSRLEWVKKYIDSVIFLSPTFAGLPSLSNLISQNLPPFPPSDEFKKTIMRMPGLHIMLPNHAVFENFTIETNLSEKYNASRAFEFLKVLRKVDDESEEIFKAEVEKFLRVPVPEPPVPSMIIYAEKTVKNRQIISIHENINDSEGARYACARWAGAICHSVKTDDLLNSNRVSEIILDFINGQNGKTRMKYGHMSTRKSETKNYMKSDKTVNHISLLKSYKTKEKIESKNSIKSATNNRLNIIKSYKTKEKIEPKNSIKSATVNRLNVIKSYKTEEKIEPKNSMKSDKKFALETISFTGVTGDFADEDYLNSHMVDPLDITSSIPEADARFPIDNMFDGKLYTFYMSKDQNKPFNLEFTFSATVSLDAFLIDPCITYSGSSASFNGFPYEIKVYTDSGSGSYALSASFNGAIEDSWTRVQFSFPSPVTCSKMKLEVVNVDIQSVLTYPDSGYFLTIDNLFFVQRLSSNPSCVTTNFGVFRCDAYVNTQKVSTAHFTYTSTVDGFANYPLSNAFDENPSSYFIPSDASSAVSIEVSFDQTVTLDGFLYDLAYVDNGARRVFHGFPKKVNVYSSTGSEAFQLKKSYQATSVYYWSRVLFNFGAQITCDKLKLEFLEASQQSIQGSSKVPVIGGLFFIQAADSIAYTSATGNYSDSEYLSTHVVPPSMFTYSAPKEKDGYPISNAFDEDISTVYVSSIANNRTYNNIVSIDFTSQVTLEAILYDVSVNADGSFNGCPTKVLVYSSTSEGPFKLNALFEGTPSSGLSRISFRFREPLTCEKLRIEFVDVTTQKLAGGESKSPVIADLIFVIPPPPLVVEMPIEDICQQGQHCSYEGGPNKQVTVTIEASDFSNIQSGEDGGAIRLTNAGIICAELTFRGCQTKSGGGGGIYINNDNEEGKNIINLRDVNLSNCRANYGGAIFIYTCSESEKVEIFECFFENNQALRGDPSSTGGSAIFITAKSSSIFGCKFANNVGDDQLKMYNCFRQKRRGSKILQTRPKTSNIVKSCRFEIDRLTKCSIYYVTSGNGSFCFVRNCVFVGVLYPGNYHISGSSLENLAPKLVVENCKFSTDYSHSFNPENSTAYISINMQKQEFDYSESVESNENEIFKYSMLIVGVLFVIILIVVAQKQSENAEMETVL